MGSDVINKDISSLSFEDAIKELELIVESLENGSIGLEESISKYERGEALKVHCNSLLNEAEARIEKINLNASGNIENSQSLKDNE
ncbi:MAG: exodeoxyribonuclease VII small subunit [Rhodobiaceae bacterium]|jgi:exodeoxyribonuclease VII small subunit|nr:exodeoxyribonuclease VII small subunit [Rhodobiaceae bacterium]MBT5640005.1 exodeoxyribonuclease VII small subunit [Rhodobiaceae bacterium]MBT6222927.1 exodeoxyribonuclease VII small subunit [Rhodobiaceae bacterium]MDB4831645.1 exodeoxyribonuclease VII small subunit [Hyphomicrobiales bacterium]MDC3272495.1 exodeoxyribonuclease VII small subunit [Hyphomicrobiales bacterium]|tara:strand:+ start:238 stop:495 length:258 start_codon:yes stop_codon:yes gene_type:complete